MTALLFHILLKNFRIFISFKRQCNEDILRNRMRKQHYKHTLPLHTVKLKQNICYPFQENLEKDN